MYVERRDTQGLTAPRHVEQASTGGVKIADVSGDEIVSRKPGGLDVRGEAEEERLTA